MKLWRFKIEKTPRPIPPVIVSAVSAALETQLAEVWEAIGLMRSDISDAKRLGSKAERAAYRKHPGEKENGDGTFVPLLPGEQNQPSQRAYRTGDPMEVR
jgi:hypothetical protein